MTRMTPRRWIQFPPANVRGLSQDEVYFYLQEGGAREKIRLHDYARIYAVPGLYEQVVDERLKCQSPATVVNVLRSSRSQHTEELKELRILDLGAGNGMVGDELKKHGVSRPVGVDMIPEAKAATVRDRPGIYDAYYVADFTNLGDDEKDERISWSLDALVSVAAPGFGDIPAPAFLTSKPEMDGEPPVPNKRIQWTSLSAPRLLPPLILECWLPRQTASGYREH